MRIHSHLRKLPILRYIMEANYAIQDMRNNRLALMGLGFETSFYGV